tara:strand:- start:7451 stop:8044 length:594 start_codon:yes stop_codon:yes gene_type:complete
MERLIAAGPDWGDAASDFEKRHDDDTSPEDIDRWLENFIHATSHLELVIEMFGMDSTPAGDLRYELERWAARRAKHPATGDPSGLEERWRPLYSLLRRYAHRRLALELVAALNDGADVEQLLDDHVELPLAKAAERLGVSYDTLRSRSIRKRAPMRTRLTSGGSVVRLSDARAELTANPLRDPETTEDLTEPNGVQR